MDPRKLPFNALIVGPTNSGNTQYLLNQLHGPFRGKFDYIVLFCPTFVKNKTYDGFVDKDPRVFVVVCLQHEIESWLKLASYFFEKTNTLFVLDDCAASKDVKGRTSQLVNLGFSACHDGISVWVFTQQITSIAKPFRENVAAIVLFYTPSGKTTKAIFEDYAGEITHDEFKELIAWLKERKFSHLVFSLRYPMGSKLKFKDLKNNKHYIIHTMDNPAKFHKLTILSQLLVELNLQTLEAQTRVIKAAGEEDLRTMLLNRYPLKLNEMPNTMTSLIKAVEELLPDIKRIIEN